MTPEQEQEFAAMKEKIAYYDQVFSQILGGKPEAISQVVVSQVVVKSPTAARVLRIVTTQGEYNILAE